MENSMESPVKYQKLKAPTSTVVASAFVMARIIGDIDM